jgi:hypothetical protein
LNLLTLPTYYRRSRRYLRFGLGHLLMYVFGRFGAVRLLMVWRYSQRTSTPVSITSSSLVTTANVDDVVHKICQDGFCTGLNLRRDVVERLLAFSSLATGYGDGHEDYPFQYRDRHEAQRRAGRQFRLCRYNHALSSSHALRALASDALLLGIARKYLRTEPVLVGARMWWSLAGPANSEQKAGAGQSFHYDIDGYRGLAFFFYLTDVGREGGPHVYVRGTHVKKSWRHLVSIYKGRTDAEIDECYGPESQVLLCGPAGSGFAEDIFGFHKGMDPESVDRLIVQVRYGLRDYGAGRDD